MQLLYTSDKTAPASAQASTTLDCYDKPMPRGLYAVDLYLLYQFSALFENAFQVKTFADSRLASRLLVWTTSPTIKAVPEALRAEVKKWDDENRRARLSPTAAALQYANDGNFTRTLERATMR